jgi:integrase
LDSILVKTMLKGKANTEEPRKQKIAMTPGLLLELKRFIIKCNLPLEDKMLIWAMATLMYSGSLRGGEIMGEEDDEFDPRNILMEEDVRIKVMKTGDGRRTKLVSCIIKNPKELPGTINLEIEMFKTEGKFCPVAAVEKLRRNRTGNKNKPFMTRKNGKIVTKKWLNGFLKKALAKMVDYENETVSSHSFRSGVATAMARCGYSDEEIQRQGRWRSEAFLKYIRLGRSQRLEQQRTLAEKMAQIAEAEVEERGGRRR